MRQGTTDVRLEIVPGATHLFEEPGTLEEVARRASEWFSRFLVSDRSPRGWTEPERGDRHPES
jgi:putative phosphoribosyl transferase